METTNLLIIIAIIVGILFPGYAIWSGRNLRQWLTSNPDQKVKVFRLTAIQLIVLMIFTLIPFWSSQNNLSHIGLDFISNPYWVISLFVLSLLALLLFRKIKLSEESAEKIANQNARIQFLLPTNDREYKHMIFVSFVAGICEEVIYRGFLFWFIMNYLPLFPSIILANLPFALGHLTTTGTKNTVKAFVLALLFTGAYLLTKSLWLPILLHIIVDLYATILSHKTYQLLNLKNNLDSVEYESSEIRQQENIIS